MLKEVHLNMSKENKVQLNVRVDPNLRREAMEAAKESNRTWTNFVETSIAMMTKWTKRNYPVKFDDKNNDKS